MEVHSLVLAAGYGTRSLWSLGIEKQRVRVLGVPLICYPLASLTTTGIRSIYVATAVHTYGYISESITECGVDAELIIVPEPWRGNGYTLLYSISELARRGDPEWVIVAMSDHIVHPSMTNALARALNSVSRYWYVILADREPRYVDYIEATKLDLEDNKVLKAGKSLENASAVDTGVHAVRPELASLLYRSYTIEIINMVNILAREGLVGAVTGVDGAPWTDVDGYEDLYAVECGSARVVAELTWRDALVPSGFSSGRGVICGG